MEVPGLDIHIWARITADILEDHSQNTGYILLIYIYIYTVYTPTPHLKKTKSFIITLNLPSY